MDDIRLWVYFAHQTAQPLPEAGGNYRWPQLRADGPMTELHRKQHDGGRELEGIQQVQEFPPTTQGTLPSHWIMSSSFSTLAKVATLFLSK